MRGDDAAAQQMTETQSTARAGRDGAASRDPHLPRLTSQAASRPRVSECYFPEVGGCERPKIGAARVLPSRQTVPSRVSLRATPPKKKETDRFPQNNDVFQRS